MSQPSTNKKIAIYPGSFDPITTGHLNILERALRIFDEVIILVSINSQKKGRFSISERVEMIKEAVKDRPNVKVDSYDGLTVRYAKEHGSRHLIRGLRAVTDYEYEFQLSHANAYLDKEVDMVFFMANESNSFISSSGIMEMAKNGGDISSLVPESVLKRLKK